MAEDKETLVDADEGEGKGKGKGRGKGEEGESLVAMIKEARSWYLTALLIFVLLAVGLVIFLANVRSMDFFYALF